MDWHVDSADDAAVASVARDLAGYLRRHGERGSDLAAAELAVEQLLAEVAERTSGPAWVHLDWSGEGALLEVVGARPGGRRTRFSRELPVRRERRRDAGRPALPQLDSLPASEEADEQGVFGREAFLRALVVQLAQQLEREHGPDAAEAAIANVGRDVGGRMEDEYRRARGIVERLTAEQIADLYVRLKHAIDGDFYVIEASDERIVLGNRRCPFGDVVKRAPGLCRMTSSVFGGIAARNAGASTVQLDRRIAVGDPECQVTVWLGAHGRGARHGHVYELEQPEPEEPVRVVLAENYAYLRDPIVEALAESSIEVVSHANTAASLLVKVAKYRPDVAIIDFREADTEAGIEVAAELRTRYPGTGVLVLAEHLEAPASRDLLAAGSAGVGYLLKDRLSQDELVDAIRRVAAGATTLDPELVPELVGGTDPLAELSPRELEVLELISEGLSNQAIAEELVVTKRAVEKHVKGIFRKLALDATSERERRVLATLRFLESGRPTKAADSRVRE